MILLSLTAVNRIPIKMLMQSSLNHEDYNKEDSLHLSISGFILTMMWLLNDLARILQITEEIDVDYLIKWLCLDLRE